MTWQTSEVSHPRKKCNSINIEGVGRGVLGLHFLQFGGILKKNMSSHFNLTGLVNVSHLRRYCVSHKPELRGENCLSEKGIPPSSFILELQEIPSKIFFFAGWGCERGRKWSFLTLNGTWAQVTIEGISFHANHGIQVLFLTKQYNSVFVSCDESAVALLCRRQMAFSDWELVLYSFFVSKAVNNIQKVD